ncbi:hypothetical protein EMIT0347P_50344 [Pseudomonas sp. IT-347P]
MACSDLSVQDEGAVYRLGKARDLSMINRGNASANVGAGLLANALCQATLLLTEAPPSRASPLPHLGKCVNSD